MPLYVLGLMGMTRRMQHYDVAAWRPWLLIAAAGAGVILCGIILQIAQIAVSIRHRDELRDETGDPWNGRSLEWATASPPPAFNFAVLPRIEGEDVYWTIKQRAIEQARLSDEPDYTDIEMPRNSPTGFICAFFATCMGFALIWHIWWMVGLAAFGAFAPSSFCPWRDEDEYIIPSRGGCARRSPQPQCSPRSVAAFAARAMSAFQAAAGSAGMRASSQPAQHATGGLIAKRILVGYGFWIFLLSDIIMFSAFFATYAVLVGATAGGPSGHDLFDLRNVAIETVCLLLSSFTCGIASIGAQMQRNLWFHGAMAATFILGTAFLAIEIHEFAGMVAQGAGRREARSSQRSFSLVGCHGLHVTAGLLWLLTMMAQVFAKGYRPDIRRRILCFGLFWHALDIIWVGVFTVVYLMGAGQ